MSAWIPIKINPLFLVLIFAIGLMNAPSSFAHILIWAGVIFLSVLVHEWGHALTAIFFGQRAEIELFGLGGVTYRQGPRLKLWKEFIVTLNGPLAGFSLAILSSLIVSQIPLHLMKGYFSYALHVTLLVNVFWTFLNLLPVYPLDGGHLVRIVLEGMMGSRGVKYAFLISLILAVVGSFFFLLIGAFLAAALFFLFAFESYRGWKSSLVLSEYDRDEEAQSIFKEAETQLSSGDRQQAYETFEKVRERTKRGVLFLAATEHMAQISAEEGNYKKAYELLEPVQSQLDVASLAFLHHLAYRLEKWTEAIRLGTLVYRENPSFEVATLNALAHAVKGEAEPAVGWLKAAISEGAPDVHALLARREFDHIRGDPGFRELES